MELGLAALYGHYFWLLLSFAAFLLGWRFGPRCAAALFNLPAARDASAPVFDTGGATARTEIVSLTEKPAPQNSDKDVQFLTQIAGLRAELKAVQTLRDESAAQLSKRDQAFAELKGRMAVLQKDYDRLAANNTKLTEERSKLSVDSETASAALKEWETEKAALAAQVAKQKEELDSITRTKLDVEEQLSVIQHSFNTMQSDMGALRQGRANAEARLQARETETDELKRKCGETQALLEGERNKVLNFAAEIQKLSAEAVSFAQFIDSTRKTAGGRALKSQALPGESFSVSSSSREDAANILAAETPASQLAPETPLSGEAQKSRRQYFPMN
jgi:DNA repair exonuclease SbcCD ATPase subunit